MKSYEGTSLTIGQVYRRPISSSISSHFGQTKHLSRLETERHHIASFDVGGDESLASKSSL